MKQLGYRHIGYRRDLLKAYRSDRLEQVFKVIDQNDSFEDWPYPLMYRELWERYGTTARYILTTRISSPKWLASLENHAMFTHPLRHSRKLAYGYRYPHYAQQAHIDFYERHNAAVRAFFSEPERARFFLDLCWEKGHGWPELCGFLGVPAPDMPVRAANATASRKPSGYERANYALMRFLSVVPALDRIS
jgi:hypothetical protein